MFALRLLAATAVEKVIQQALKADADSALLLAPLQGKSVLVDVVDWQLRCVVLIADGRVYIRLNTDEPADTCVQGTLLQLLHFAQHFNQSAALQQYGLKVSGDLGVLEMVQKVWMQLHLDLEALLSTVCGDHVAHLVNKPIQKLCQWQQQCYHSTCQDITEALQEEKRILVGREEVEDFYQDLAQFRQDLQRYQARLQQMGVA